MTSSTWTESRVARLKTLWREGRTAEEVARALGDGVTRSAVLGKVMRLGLSEGRPARAAPPGKAASRRREGRSDPTTGLVTGQTTGPTTGLATGPRTKPATGSVATGSDGVGHRPPAAKPSVAARAVAPDPLQRPPGAPDIVAVGSGQCRWPYGEPGRGMVCCGRPVARGAFCAGHAEIGYRAPPGGAASLLALAGYG